VVPKRLAALNRADATHGIDVAKGWVIFLVVIGHVLESKLLNGDETPILEVAYAWIYSFHMPFYFLLSGWLFKGPQPPGRYLLSKSQRLLVPYMAWLLLFNAVAIAGLCANIARGSLTPEKQVFYADLFQNQAYGGMYVHGYEVVLWFPTCLFLTQQLANAWYASLHRYTVWVLATVLYVVGYLNQYAASDFHLPWGANVVAGAMPFFVVGHEARRSGWVPEFRLGLPWLMVLVAIAAGQIPLQFHMRAAVYGIPVVSTVAAASAFMLFLWLASKNWPSSVRTASELLGRTSMTIMYSHCYFVVLLASLGVSTWWIVVPVVTAAGVGLHRLFLSVRPLKVAFAGE
jgi:fucose 4-O-acetylase-like acetyltransferase